MSIVYCKQDHNKCTDMRIPRLLIAVKSGNTAKSLRKTSSKSFYINLSPKRQVFHRHRTIDRQEWNGT